MQKISVVIITKNEERHIENAVQSVLFADEVLVLDSGSTDATCNLAGGLGARVEHQEWLGFGRQKNKAVELASNDWVFVLDADEQITEQLKDEIIETLKKFDAFEVFEAHKMFPQWNREKLESLLGKVIKFSENSLNQGKRDAEADHRDKKLQRINAQIADGNGVLGQS